MIEYAIKLQIDSIVITTHRGKSLVKYSSALDISGNKIDAYYEKGTYDISIMCTHNGIGMSLSGINTLLQNNIKITNLPNIVVSCNSITEDTLEFSGNAYSVEQFLSITGFLQGFLFSIFETIISI